VEDDEVIDPTFGEDNDIERKAKQLGSILQHFRSRWKHEYLTSLREFHRVSGNNNQRIAVSDVVLVHDDCMRIYWKLEIIEFHLWEGQSGESCNHSLSQWQDKLSYNQALPFGDQNQL